MASPQKAVSLHASSLINNIDMNTRHLLPTWKYYFGKCLLFPSIFLFALSSCSDDEEPAMRPTLPADGAASVKSITHLGNVMSTYDWTFSYSDGRLYAAQGTMRDPSPEIDRSFSYTSQLSYGPWNVGVYNSSGENVQLQLSSQGYIERMTVNRNIYEFQYRDGRLSGWNKTIFENSFGQVEQYKSSATITYDNGNLAKIDYVGVDNEAVTLTFTTSSMSNGNGLLPEGISQELGCLGFEHLYYAGLLGRPTNNLVQRVNFTHSRNPELDYTLDFEYGTSNGNVTLCNYHTPDGGVASVSYAY